MGATGTELGQLARELLEVGRANGLDAVGVADAQPFLDTRRHLQERKAAGLHAGMHFTYGDPVRATDPGRIVPGARSLVVGARSYLRAEPAKVGTGGEGSEGAVPGLDAQGANGPCPMPPLGRVARYSWRDHYAPLRAALGAVAGRLAEEGWRAQVVVDDNALVDREAARRAGLGWYGKNTLLLLPGRGSWYVLGSVVTDAPLPGAGVLVDDGCGACTRCLSACPTGALVAPGVLDARRCLAWLLEAPGWFPVEMRAALGGRIYGCDECQEACPPNRAAARHRPPPAPGPGDEPWLDLVDLLGRPDNELMAHLGRWYIPRRQARYLRRNALVALGNVGQGHDPRVEAALRDALDHPDALVRGHAVWAAAALGRHDLLGGLEAEETDMGVRAELGAAAGGTGGAGGTGA